MSETGCGKRLILTDGSVSRALIQRPFAFVDPGKGIREGRAINLSEISKQYQSALTPRKRKKPRGRAGERARGRKGKGARGSVGERAVWKYRCMEVWRGRARDDGVTVSVTASREPGEAVSACAWNMEPGTWNLRCASAESTNLYRCSQTGRCGNS